MQNTLIYAADDKNELIESFNIFLPIFTGTQPNIQAVHVNWTEQTSSFKHSTPCLQVATKQGPLQLCGEVQMFQF